MREIPGVFVHKRSETPGKSRSKLQFPGASSMHRHTIHMQYSTLLRFCQPSNIGHHPPPPRRGDGRGANPPAGGTPAARAAQRAAGRATRGRPRPEAEPARARPQAGARDCAEPEESSPPRGQGAHQAGGFLFLVKGDIMPSESCPKIGENPVFASLKLVDITSSHYNVRLKLYPDPEGEVRPVELLALSRPAYNPEGWEPVGRDAPPPPLAAGGEEGDPPAAAAQPRR